MSASRPRVAAARLLELRTPLARVSLAASQLERESASPSSQALAATIGDAVDQIDAGIERLLPLLADAERSDAPPAALAEVIPALVRRLSPAIAAREARLVVDDSGFHAVRCDPHRTRRAGVALLRAAGHWLGRGGEIRLSLAQADERAGLQVVCAGGSTTLRDGAELQALESACPGADAEVQLHEHEARATLWLDGARPALPAEAEPCGAC